jgi:hypothetical protein
MGSRCVGHHWNNRLAGRAGMLLPWERGLRCGQKSRRRDLQTTAPSDPVTPVAGRRSMNTL